MYCGTLFEYVLFYFMCDDEGHGLFPGRKPSRRHDNAPLDPARTECADECIGFIAPTIWTKADWVELSTTMGFPTWASNDDPCICCFTRKANMHDYSTWNILEIPWEPKTSADLQKAAKACEMEIVVERSNYALLKSSLEYDKRDDGARGLGVRSAVPQMNLEIGDRVEQCVDMRDVDEIFRLRNFPCTIKFWRRKNETSVRRVNPLFDDPGGYEIGLTTDTFALDILHGFHFGPVACFVYVVMMEHLEQDAWKTLMKTDVEKLELGVLSMKAELWEYYDSVESSKRITRLKSLKLSMIHNQSETLKAKAGETWGLLLFCLDILKKGLIPNSEIYVSCGSCLLRMMEIWKAEPINMSVRARQESTSSSSRPSSAFWLCHLDAPRRPQEPKQPPNYHFRTHPGPPKLDAKIHPQ